MKNTSLLGLVLVVLLASPSYAQSTLYSNSTTGDVGIGTSSPAGTLDVEGGTAAASTNGSSINLTAQSAGTGNKNGGNIILTPGVATGTGTPGYVGIGTTAPGTEIDINGALTERGIAAPSMSSTGQGIIYFDSTANEFEVSQDGSAYAPLVGSSSQWTTSGSNIYYTTGAVSIGTTAATSGNALTLGGNLVFAPTSKGISGVTDGSTATTGTVGEIVSSVCYSAGNSGTVTITNASPAVITSSTIIPLGPNCPVYFTTSGSLPTGLSANTPYYVIGSSISGNTFKVATSIANATAGTAVNTSSAGSGTQTITSGFVMSTSSSVYNVGAVSLSAGDWICSGEVNASTSGSTNFTGVLGGLTTTSATFPQYKTGQQGTSFAPYYNISVALATVPFNVISTTTIYAVAANLFTGSDPIDGSAIWCNRIR